MTLLESSIRRTLEILIPKINAQRSQSYQPIVIGITGLQGSGKSTWAAGIVDALSNYYNLHAIAVSLDDFYKTHDDLMERREKDPQNKLYRTRGQPGTHDEKLAHGFFQGIKDWDVASTKEVRIPSFDKSRYNGEGDRAPREEWPVCQKKPDIVVFEGWCVGFKALPEAELRSKVENAEARVDENDLESITTLADHRLVDLLEVNQYLKKYNNTFMGPQHLDFFIHLDTDDLRNVYKWRLQQEHAMIKKKGTGMTDEAVRTFVRGYMPSYELYLDGLRQGFFEAGTERQVRAVMNVERGVEKIEVI